MSEKKRIFVQAGEYAVVTDDTVLVTLLGSCVAVCLYDPVNKVVGMNHFLLSRRKHLPALTSKYNELGRYGEQAMQQLLSEMAAQGAVKSNLRAKAFGGASVLHSLCAVKQFEHVGENNCQFIHEYLQRENIPLLASSLGGNHGMTVEFYPVDHSVRVTEITQSGSCDTVLQAGSLQRSGLSAAGSGCFSTL